MKDSYRTGSLVSLGEIKQRNRVHPGASRSAVTVPQDLQGGWVTWRSCGTVAADCAILGNIPAHDQVMLRAPWQTLKI